MGRHTAIECPELDRLVDDSCTEVGREVEALRIPRLAGVVLGGGYGRGEGGVRETGDGAQALFNDLDFFAITEEGASADEIAAITAALEPVSKKWTDRLGLDVDFTVRTPWRIKHDEDRLMIQELVRGYFDVAGCKGERLFAHIRLIDAMKVPWMEAARLLMNRGMGLLLAMEGMGNGERGMGNGEQGMGNGEQGMGNGEQGMGNGEEGRGKREQGREFVLRNINKCVLGAGDARLVARHDYRWKAAERGDAFGDALYRAAVEWKFLPRDEAVCSWETAQKSWCEAFDEVMDAGRSEGALSRSLWEGARWVVRRRALGDLSGFGRNCTVRVLEGVARCVRERRRPDDALMRDWRIFN